MGETMTEKDPWEPESDLVSDYAGEAVDVWFAVDANLNDSPTFLFIKMKTDNEQHPEITERYNCGPDWRSYDGGETVVHPTRTTFSGRSQAGTLLAKIKELGAAPAMKARGAPTIAKTWVGTRWWMEAVSKPYKLRDGTEGVSVRNYPSRFLGTEEDGEEIISAVEASREVVDSPIMRIITSLAKDLPHKEWVDKVLDVDGVLADDELVRRLPDTTDSGLYETLRRQ